MKMNECVSCTNKVLLLALGNLLVSSGMVLAAGILPAQSFQAGESIQFSFAPPGARSLALGGAFLGLADDATAAFANPAGLVTLTQPEVSAEERNSSYKTPYTDHGHLFGSPRDFGLDDVSGLVSKTTTDTRQELGFASFVYPHDPFRFAVYRHEAADFGASFLSQGPFVGGDPYLREPPFTTALRLRIIDLGVAVGFKITEAWSIGVGASSYHLILSSLTQTYSTASAGSPQAPPGSFFGPPLISAGNLQSVTTMSASESKLAATAGLLWKINPHWRAGTVYRGGPGFDLIITQAEGPQGNHLRPPTSSKGVFKVPDVYGAGVAFQPTETWTISADYDRVRYSQFARNMVSAFVAASPGAFITSNELTINDANEIHLGLEYVIASLKHPPVALRMGGWIDPDHRLRFAGTGTGTDLTSSLRTRISDLLAVAYPRGATEYHISGGIGYLLKKFEVGAAFDYSRFVSVASLSGVVRF